MRKLLTSILVSSIAGSLFAGGLVTNTNQSTSWVRLPSRNASTDIDAVYFNPAGLMKLENGFHVSLSNQTIFQTKEVENFYKGPGDAYGLNQSLYTGDVSAPVFPSISAVYKMDKLAFSIGFYPVGGGGSAEYGIGLPSFEMTPSDLVPALAATDLDPVTAGVQGAKQYRLDAYLNGKSVYFGLQGGVSYKINDWISVAAGLRYVMANNSYNGHLTDIDVNLGTVESPVWKGADEIMTGISQMAATSGNGLQSAITAGLVSGTAPISPTVAAGLTALGINPTGLNNSQAVYAFTVAATKYSNNATLLGDQYADVEQTGNGITPFFSVNLSPNEKLNIGIKYEMKTSMEIENNTTSDFIIGYEADLTTQITMFPDGAKTPSDMPAVLTAGVDYKLSDALKLSIGGNYFFDKSANYGHKMDLDGNSTTPSTFVSNSYIIDDNGYSIHGGLQYDLSDNLLVSGGYIFSNKGVNSNYQSDLTYFLGSHTFGAGGAYKIIDNLMLNIGASYTLYLDDEQLIDHVFSATGAVYTPRETYAKNAMIFSVGLDFSF